MKIRKLKVHVKKKCPCWQKGHWFIQGCDTCNGTKEREPCKCNGDRSKCDFYRTEVLRNEKETRNEEHGVD